MQRSLTVPAPWDYENHPILLGKLEGAAKDIRLDNAGSDRLIADQLYELWPNVLGCGYQTLGSQ